MGIKKRKIHSRKKCSLYTIIELSIFVPITFFSQLTPFSFCSSSSWSCYQATNNFRIINALRFVFLIIITRSATCIGAYYQTILVNSTYIKEQSSQQAYWSSYSHYLIFQWGHQKNGKMKILTWDVGAGKEQSHNSNFNLHRTWS